MGGSTYSGRAASMAVTSASGRVGELTLGERAGSRATGRPTYDDYHDRGVAAPEARPMATRPSCAYRLDGAGFTRAKASRMSWASSVKPPRQPNGPCGPPPPTSDRRATRDAHPPVPSRRASQAHGGQALDRASLASFEALGLMGVADGLARGLVRLVPHGDIVLASGPPGSRWDPCRLCRRPASAVVTLADLTIRRPVGTALDVGTGCGIQALLAARHAERVVATDINERALVFAAVECRPQ